MTAADRPSVTDDARAEAWAEGYDAGASGELLPEENPYWAAGRAETTTAGVAWDPGAEADYQAGRWCGQCRYGVVEDPPCCTQPAETTTATVEDAAHAIWHTETQDLGGYTLRDARQVAQALADAGLLATARARPTDAQVLAALNAMHPRAAAPSLDYWDTEADKMRAALRAAWTEG